MKNRIISILFFFIIAFTVTAKATAINVIIREDRVMQRWLRNVVSLYEKKNPDKKVNIQIIGGTEGDYFTKIALILKSGSGVDVIFEDGFMLRGDVNAGHITPIPEVKQWPGWKHFFPSLRKSVTLDGKVYAVPMSTDTRGLFYNVNIFKKAGIKTPWNPKNWNDLFLDLKKIKEKVPDVYPISFSAGAVGEATSMQTAEMFLYGTDDPLYRNGKWLITSNGLYNTLSFIQKLFKNGLGVRIDIALSAQYGNYVGQTLAPEQKAAVILDGCWLRGVWLQKFPIAFKSYDFAAMPTEYGQKPGHTTMSGGWVMAISKKSKKKKIALNFIEFALDKKNMLEYVKTTQNLATRKDVAEMKRYPAHLKTATSFLNFAHFRPANENYPIVSSYLQEAVEAVASERLSPLDAMNQFANALERALGKDNVLKLYKEK